MYFIQICFNYTQATKRSHRNGVDDNAWNCTLSPTALFSSRTLDISTSPKHLSLGKVATGLASANSGLNEGRGIKEGLLKEEEWQLKRDVEGITSRNFCTWPHQSHCLTDPQQVWQNILVSYRNKWAVTYRAVVPNFYCSSCASGSRCMFSKPCLP